MFKGPRSQAPDVLEFVYHIPTKKVDAHCKLAAGFFAQREMSSATEAYELALGACAPGDSLDRAFVLRRLANTVIRSDDIEESEEKALAYLLESIEIHETIIDSSNPKHQMGCLEYQRCLNSLCSIASNRKNGSLIKEFAGKLLILAQKTSNLHYEFDALDYLYMVEFSSGNLDSAKEKVERCIEVAKKINEEIKEKNPQLSEDKLHTRMKSKDTCYRHIAKIKLLQKAPPDDILISFWACYDGHKKLAKSKNKDRLLTDDLTLLFMIKAYEFSSKKEKDPLVHALRVVGKEAKIQFSKQGVQDLMKNLNKKKTDLEAGEALPLSHSFFFGSEELQPHFSIPITISTQKPLSELPPLIDDSGKPPSALEQLIAALQCEIETKEEFQCELNLHDRIRESEKEERSKYLRTEDELKISKAKEGALNNSILQLRDEIKKLQQSLSEARMQNSQLSEREEQAGICLMHAKDELSDKQKLYQNTLQELKDVQSALQKTQSQLGMTQDALIRTKKTLEKMAHELKISKATEGASNEQKIDETTRKKLEEVQSELQETQKKLREALLALRSSKQPPRSTDCGDITELFLKTVMILGASYSSYSNLSLASVCILMIALSLIGQKNFWNSPASAPASKNPQRIFSQSAPTSGLPSEEQQGQALNRV